MVSFISNEGEFRLAVSNILKKNHVVHIVYGLMFYSVLRRLNPVSLRRFAYVAVSRASQDAMLFTDNAAQLGPQLAVETSKTAVLDADKLRRLPTQLDCADKLVRGVARAPNRAIASGTHRLRPPTTG